MGRVTLPRHNAKTLVFRLTTVYTSSVYHVATFASSDPSGQIKKANERPLLIYRPHASSLTGICLIRGDYKNLVSREEKES